MFITKAIPENFDDLLLIGHKFFKYNAYREHTVLDEDSLIATFWLLHDDHVLLIVVNEEGEIVGTAGAFIAPLYWNANYKQGVEAFWWIDKQYRKSGVGTELRVALEKAAYEKGARFWNMIALKESMHDEVCAGYEKAGMTHVETVYMKVL